ncbi:hypothetical protein PNQ29_06670 [Halobacterium salinarum]|uniref:hypothetical protein n=1 Tax=Halobacterium salinarum TaxID=2242 RepID=UPI002553C036|nr:hypothetical protein [Halobacterium salinarum]MDL0118569.1 hypothetical protein [Halobacterium salinarum]MDL0119412.1 hypothetical protein [Halobacterium salinarum]
MTESTAIRIAARDRMLAVDLLDPDENRVETGMSNTIDGDTKITYQGTRIQKGVGGPEISEWVLQHSSLVKKSRDSGRISSLCKTRLRSLLIIF